MSLVGTKGAVLKGQLWGAACRYPFRRLPPTLGSLWHMALLAHMRTELLAFHLAVMLFAALLFLLVAIPVLGRSEERKNEGRR